MILVDLLDLVHAKLGQRQTLPLNVGDSVIEDLHLEYLRGDLHLTRLAHGILAQGRLEALVETDCTRCLTPFFVPITLEIEDLISLPGAELTQERPVRVNEDGRANLAPLVREYAWLGMPLNPSCSATCEKLCAVCGGNVNLGECTCEAPIDPRWEALRSLL